MMIHKPRHEDVLTNAFVKLFRINQPGLSTSSMSSCSDETKDV